jgi:hypothetical protein
MFSGENREKYLVCIIYVMMFRGEKHGKILSLK